MEEIKVIMDPAQRSEYVEGLLALDGLSHVREDEHAAYCPISLTSTPYELKKEVQRRQDILMNSVLPHSTVKCNF